MKSINKNLIRFFIRVLGILKLKFVLLFIKAKPSNEKLIVFHTVRYARLLHDGFFAFLLAQRGFNVIIILDDGVLSHWDNSSHVLVNKKLKNLNPFKTCLKSKMLSLCILHFYQFIFYNKNVKYIFYSKIPGIKKLNNSSSKYLIYFAKSSCIRYYQNTELDYNNKEVNHFYNLSLKNAKLSQLAANYIMKFNPYLTISNLGVYSVMGPFHYFMSTSGFRTKLYCRCPYIDNKFWVHDVKAQVMSLSNEWQEKRNSIYPISQLKQQELYLQKRLSLDSNDTKIYFSNTDFEIPKITKENNITFCAFPNVVWDGHEHERNYLFNGVFDWMLKLIYFFKENNHLNLIIRYHPSESTLFSNTVKLHDLLTEKVDFTSTKNIYIIPSGRLINTYDIIKSCVDIGLIYDGILGLELPLLDKPVIFSSKGAIDGCYISGTDLFKTQKEYFDHITNYSRILKNFNNNKNEVKRKCLQYLHWYLFDMTYFSPTANILTKNFEDFPIKHFTKYNFNPEYNRELNKTINAFLK